MKTYYGYSESSSKTRWNYYKNQGYKLNLKEDDIHIRYCAFCHKSNMISVIGNLIRNTNWVKERIAETANSTELQLCNENPGYIVVYNDVTNEILEKIKLK